MDFTEKLNNLYEEIRLSIIKNVADKGVESTNYNKIIVKVPDDLAFNLDNGRYVEEVGQHDLIDNQGYIYNFGVLDYEQLTELADWLENL